MESHLQIISGARKGRRLFIPSGARPTQNRARIALFNAVGALMARGEIMRPRTVWDAFAGSGAFGLEFLSRGWAGKVIFTDTDGGAVRAIKANLRGFDPESFSVMRADAMPSVADFGAQSDLVFIDPPYADAGIGAEFAKKFADAAKPGAIVIWEMECAANAPRIPSRLAILKDKTYGRGRFIMAKTLCVASDQTVM